VPGIGVSLAAFQSAFEPAGYAFKSYDNNRVQGDYQSPDARTWIMLVLQGPTADLSTANLTVMNDTDSTIVANHLTLFFKVAFPDEADRNTAGAWFASNSGGSSGKTTIGKVVLSFVRGTLPKYSINVARAA
jgi:hypothetical protein